MKIYEELADPHHQRILTNITQFLEEEPGEEVDDKKVPEATHVAKLVSKKKSIRRKSLAALKIRRKSQKGDFGRMSSSNIRSLDSEIILQGLKVKKDAEEK